MKIIIIDDEYLAVELLARKIRKYFPDFSIVAECDNGITAIDKINSLRPDLVFLDIEMPEKNAFMILDEVKYKSFVPIFVTAYDEFAIRAIKYGAVDYILKPYEDMEVVLAIRKAEKYYHALRNGQNYNLDNHTKKIALPYQNGLALISIEDIIFCESDNNYSHFYTVDNRHFTVVKTLKDVQELLSSSDFMRIHRQFLINLKHVKKINKNENFSLNLVNGKEIPISRSQKDEFMTRFSFL